MSFGGGPGGGAGGADEDEDVEGEAFMQGSLQTLLTQLVKKEKRPAAAAETDLQPLRVHLLKRRNVFAL